MIEKLGEEAYLLYKIISAPRNGRGELTQQRTKRTEILYGILCFCWLSEEDDRLPFLHYRLIFFDWSFYWCYSAKVEQTIVMFKKYTVRLHSENQSQIWTANCSLSNVRLFTFPQPRNFITALYFLVPSLCSKGSWKHCRVSNVEALSCMGC